MYFKNSAFVVFYILSWNKICKARVPTIVWWVKNPTAAAQVSAEVEGWRPAQHKGLEESGIATAVA